MDAYGRLGSKVLRVSRDSLVTEITAIRLMIIEIAFKNNG